MPLYVHIFWSASFHQFTDLSVLLLYHHMLTCNKQTVWLLAAIDEEDTPKIATEFITQVSSEARLYLFPLPGRNKLARMKRQCKQVVLLLQALFNYCSCSAVAIATVIGGNNSAVVTALMIAAHMVSFLLRHVANYRSGQQYTRSSSCFAL